MQTWTTQLLALQDAQLKIAKLQQILDKMPQELRKVLEAVTAEEAAAKALQDEAKAHELKIRSLEGQGETIRTKKKDFQAKTSIIKNNDEYRAALLQIEQCDKAVGELEDQQLQELEQLEALKVRMEAASKALMATKERADAATADVKARQADMTAKIQALANTLPTLQEGVDPEYLKEYQRLRSATLIPATQPVLVPIDGGSCGCCRMNVTAQLINNARNGKLVSCPSCRALLYWED